MAGVHPALGLPGNVMCPPISLGAEACGSGPLPGNMAAGSCGGGKAGAKAASRETACPAQRRAKEHTGQVEESIHV